MNTQKGISIGDSLKKLKLQDIVYSSVILVYLFLILALFFFSTQFFLKNINKIFSIEKNGGTQALNLEQYKLATKKLNIQTVVPQEPAMATATNIVATSSVSASLDKRTITIIVKNSTVKKGVAATLAKMLEDAGFQKPKTGNEPVLYPTTTVLIKESKAPYGQLILEIVKKYNSSATLATTSETSIFDATVIIGTK